MPPQSIAVLPFTYLAEEDSSDYFSLGMTDEILTRLAQVEALSVIGRSSVMRYEGTDKPIPQIGKELGVAHLLEGSVQQVGGRVRVRAQLVDAHTGEHEWAESYTRRTENVLELQSELARQVAGELEARLFPREERQFGEQREVDSTAYALYLQGRNLRFQETGESLTEATRLLRRSVAIDSTFAPAWAVLSTAAWLVPRRRGGELPEDVDRESLSRRAARKARRLDSTSAEAHVAMENVRELLDDDFPAAGPHFKRAVELNPGLVNAQRELGLYLMRMAQFEAAEHYLRKAARLDPASPPVFLGLGWNDLFRGNHGQAIEHFEKASSLQSDFPVRIFLILAYGGRGRTSDLRRVRQMYESDLSPSAYANLGWAYAQVGRRDSTRAILSRLQRDYGSVPLSEACLYAALGETKRALDLLEKASGNEHWYKVHPLLAPFRGEPRFQRMLEEIGLDEKSVQKTMDRLSLPPHVDGG